MLLLCGGVCINMELPSFASGVLVTLTLNSSHGSSDYNICRVCAGGALPKNVIGDITVLAGSLPNYYVFQGIELTLAYDWVDCPDDTPYGPVALGATPYVRPHTLRKS